MSLIGRFLPKGGALRGVLVLMTGTTIAQAIPVLISPLLTRLYSPEDFSVLGIYMAALSIAAVAIMGRYEHAILLEREDTAARQMASLCIVIAAAMSLVALVILGVAYNPLRDHFPQMMVSPSLFLLPVGLLFTGIYQATALQCLRQSFYAPIARSRMVQSIGTAVLSVCFGLILPLGGLLIAASIAGLCAATSMLILKTRAWDHFSLPSWQEAASFLRRHANFPKFTVPADLLSAASAQMPTFFLAYYYGMEMAGFFLLTQRVLATPLSIISSAILDVYKRKSMESVALHGNFLSLYKKTVLSLFLISIVPFIFIVFFGGYLFSFVFGSLWEKSGVMASYLSMMFFCKFIASPVTYAFYVRGKQKEDLLVQILMNIFSVSALYFSVNTFNDLKYSILLYSMTGSVFYVYYLIRSYYLSSSNES